MRSPLWIDGVSSSVCPTSPLRSGAGDLRRAANVRTRSTTRVFLPGPRLLTARHRNAHEAINDHQFTRCTSASAGTGSPLTGKTLAEQAYVSIEPMRAATANSSHGIQDQGIKGQPGVTSEQVVADLHYMGGTTLTDRIVNSLGHEIVAAARRLQVDDNEERPLFFGVTNEQDITAHLSPFSDGSGLVLISDGIIGLLNLFSSLFTRIFVADDTKRRLGVGNILRTIRNTRWPSSELVDGMAGTLRYYHAQQRFHGSNTRLEIRRAYKASEAVSLFTLTALRFLLAHEASHHFLNHATSPVAFLTEARLPVSSDEQRLEIAADELALRLVQECGRTTEEPGDHVFMALVGGVLATLAVDSTERSQFVRTGNSHPPGELRASLLQQAAPSLAVRAIPGVIRALQQSSAMASDFRGALPERCWTATYKAPSVIESARQLGQEEIRRIDTLQTLSGDASLRELARSSETSRLLAGAAIAHQGNVIEALQVWKVSPRRIEVICDTNIALKYFTLQDLLFKTFADVSGQSEVLRRSYSTLAANILLPHLEIG